MGISIESLYTPGKKSVKLPGGEVLVRALSARELDDCRGAFTLPRPAMIPDPSRGSLAPHIPDEMDPAYRAKKLEYSRAVMAAAVALAIDVQVPGTDKQPGGEGGGGSAEWLVAASSHVRAKLTQPIIDRLMEAVDELSDPKSLAEHAQGN